MNAEHRTRLYALLVAATPGPWRQSPSPYGALVADMPHPERANPEKGGWVWDTHYDGCLIGEGIMQQDRALMVELRNSAGELLASAARLERMEQRLADLKEQVAELPHAGPCETDYSCGCWKAVVRNAFRDLR